VIPRQKSRVRSHLEKRSWGKNKPDYMDTPRSGKPAEPYKKKRTVLENGEKGGGHIPLVEGGAQAG